MAAFAAIAGTLRAGSWLVVLRPPLRNGRPVLMRILCAGATLPTPFPRQILFIVFCQQISADNASILWRQGNELAVPAFTPCARHGIPPTAIRRWSRLPCLPNWPGSLPVLRR
ncbi:hypothetical protein ACLK2E_13700 [Escherichia coli]